MSMIGMGMTEILLIFGLLGGGVGGLPMEPLEAPRDNAWQATAYILPGAHVALHGNMEHAWHQIEGLVEEIAGLRLVKNSPSAIQGLAMLGISIAKAAAAGVEEVGLDFRKDLGSVTVSVRSDSEEALQILVRARGRFGDDRLSTAIKEIAVETEEYKGVTLYNLPERELPTHVICLPDESTLLLGPLNVVRALLDDGPSAEPDRARETLTTTMTRRGARAVLWGTSQVGRPGAWIYLAPPAWMVDEMFKERDLRQAAVALQGLRSMVHVSVFGRGTLTFDATSEMTAALAAHTCRAASRLSEATDPLVDALFHAAAAVGPLLPMEEVGAEVVAALTDETGLREAVDWLRRRMLTGGGAVSTAPGTLRVSMEVDSPMGLTSLLVPLSGSLGWFLMAADAGAEEVLMQEAIPAEEEPRAKAPPRMPAPEPLRGGGDGGAAPLDAHGIPTGLPPDSAEPNRRDLDPGG